MGNISKALKLDKRIGKYAYLKPGLGISGGNLERDLETFKIIQNLIKFMKIILIIFRRYQLIEKVEHIQFKKVYKNFEI